MTDDKPAEPRYAYRLDRLMCLDCGCYIADRQTHTNFHSILSGHAWALAILQNAHISEEVHNRFDVRERIQRRSFFSWSKQALAQVIGEGKEEVKPRKIDFMIEIGDKKFITGTAELIETDYLKAHVEDKQNAVILYQLAQQGLLREAKLRFELIPAKPSEEVT